jgi:hypothetical protein
MGLFKSGHSRARQQCPLCANSGCEQVQRSAPYSITSSARAITEAGTVMPSACAVLRLILRRKRAGCSNGRSAGFPAVYRHDHADWSPDVSDLRGFCRVRTFHDPAADQRRPQPGQGAGQAAGRPKVPSAVERSAQRHLARGMGMLKVAKTLGLGTGTVQRIKRAMVNDGLQNAPLVR